MALKLFVTQRTNRHVVKRLDSSVVPAVYDGNSFGTYGTPGSTTSTLQFPNGLTTDGANNVYVCDTENSRIMKLTSSLTYISSYDTSSTVGRPYDITFDSMSGDLYIVGVYNRKHVRIERITTALANVKTSGALTNPGDMYGKPMGIVKGYGAGEWIVVGHTSDLGITTETASFSSPFTVQTITGEDSKRYVGIIKHSNGDLYLNDGNKILRVNSSYVNTGDSNKVAKTTTLMSEANNGDIFLYNNDEQKIQRYTEKLNYKEDTFIDSSGGGAFVIPPGLFLDFDDGGPPIPSAPIAPGTYTTPTALAAAIKIALDTSPGAGGPFTYTVTYGTVVPNSFEIIQDPGGSGIFNLYPLTMPISGPPASIGPYIGFLTDRVGPPGPPGVPPGPPHIADVPVVGAPISIDAYDVTGLLERNV